MKKHSALLMSSLFCLLSSNLHAAVQDAPGCKDHPLLPRMPGSYIALCAESEASFDMAKSTGKTAESVHIEGRSKVLVYSAQPELKTKPDRKQIIASFEKAIRPHGGALAGMSNDIPVYKLVDGGKEILVAVLADPVGGGYAYRIIEKADMVKK
ncbi:MAG: hypothetical protein HZB95_01415 [Nitrosomonadales bacterium]|nr:hypothetical protein [Nitrosomonadales bacterium]